MAENGNWPAVFLTLAGLFLISFFGIVFFRDTEVTSERTDLSVGDLLRNRTFLTMVGIVVFYVASEVGLIAWMPYYLETHKAIGKPYIPYYVSGFFVLLMVVRFIGGFFSERVGYKKSLLIASSCGAVCLLAGQTGPAFLAVAFPLTGLFFSIVFPTVIAWATQHFTRRAGIVVGYLSTAAGMGGMFSAWVIGFVGDFVGIQNSFFLSTVFILLSIVMMISASLKRETA